MPSRFLRPIVLLPALALAGCMGSVATSKDGHSITGRAALFNSAELRTSDQAVTVTLGSKKVQVTATQITWDRGGSLQLPATWSRLQLTESSNSLEVSVDGKALASIKPAS